MPRKGAVIYAGNNARTRGVAYRVNGRLIGYEKDHKKAPGYHDRKLYIIKPLYGGADITVMGPSSVRSTPHKTWDPKDGKKELEGKLAREDVQKADGSLKMRADSSAVFRVAAQGLKEIYPETVIQPFDNVHDDEADGGRVSDSLDNFMEAMEDLNSRCSNLDFFAYCGHGMPRSLPSAGLKMGSKKWDEFVRILRMMLRPYATVIFYACSCGKPGGIVQRLSQEIPGVTVFGHLSSGHGMTNPEKARSIYGDHETFEQLLKEDYPKWKRYIKSGNDIWRRYPWMSMPRIAAEVRGEKDRLIDLEGLEYRPVTL